MSSNLDSLASSLTELGARVQRLSAQIDTEEATKQALIIPFMIALGYDVYDPTEVTPEFTADVGTKKGEKVDYAIQSEGKVKVLIECKWIGKELTDADVNQLYRYFSVSQTRVAILTNGARYKFFSDLERPNVMDQKPFLDLDIRSITADQIQEVSRLHKESFNEAEIVLSASTLKYKGQIRQVISREMSDPSDELARSLISKVYEGRITSSILQKFKALITGSFEDVIAERVDHKLKQMIALNQPERADDHVTSVLDISDRMSAKQQDSDKIETTDEEAQGFAVVFDLIKDFIDSDRIFWRDVSTYFGIILDDNNRKPICRLHFNTSQKYISLFDSDDRAEEKLPLSSIDEIATHRARLVKTILRYLEE